MPNGQIVSWDSEVRTGTDFFVPLKIKNTGDTLWLAGEEAKPGIVQLGVKLLKGGVLMSEQHGSPPFRQAIAPGETRNIVAKITAPNEPGVYTLKIDLVDQNIAWFEEHGSKALILELNVI